MTAREDCSTEVHPLSGRYFTVVCSCGWNTIVFGYAAAAETAREHTDAQEPAGASR
jgi:hypothetical protein